MTRHADYPALSEFITTKEGLESVLGRPGPRVLAKVVDALDDICLAFIARSSFVIVASHDADGRVDVSPKGDPAGFVHVLDHRTVAIPERPGNLRADTFRNVLQQPRVGLIFLVPGKGETLRISGTARLARNGWLRERLAVAGRVPELLLVVTVEEAFMHCTSAWCARRCGSRRAGGRKGSHRSERQWLFMAIWKYRFQRCARLQKTMSTSDCTDY